MDERRLEIKVGALVVGAILSVVLLLWAMGELSWSRQSGLQVAFSHTGNVVEGAPVKLGGVQVGRVNRIELKPDNRDAQDRPLQVLMQASLTKEALASLHADAQVMVSSQGPLGESYLELLPGTSAQPALMPGTVIRGVDAPRIDLVSQRLSRFLDALTRIIDEDPQAFEALVSSVSRLTLTLDKLMTANQKEITLLLAELSSASADIKSLTQFARKAMEPGGNGATLLSDLSTVAAHLRKDVPVMSEYAKVSLRGLSHISGPLTTEDGEKLKLAIERYTAAGKQLEVLSARAERILATMEAGQGTLGGFYKDPQPYLELKALITDLKKHPWKVLWKSD